MITQNQNTTKIDCDSTPLEEWCKVQKTRAFRADVNREWKALNSYYKSGKQNLKPYCPFLERMLKAAKKDFKTRAMNDKTKYQVKYRVKGGHPIAVRYFTTNFGALRVVPPIKYYWVRLEWGLENR